MTPLIVALAIVCIFMVAHFFRGRIRGITGEWSVRVILFLSGLCMRGVTRVIHGALFQRLDGSTSEIDHIFICRRGVFVIETKSRGGTVTGHISDRTWRQYIGKKTHALYSPVFQNRTHQRLIASMLGNDATVYGLVAFVGNTRLKIAGNDGSVCHEGALLWRMRKQPIRYTDAWVSEMYQQLSRLNISSMSTRREHIREVQKKYR